jgi:hypothetical protein
VEDMDHDLMMALARRAGLHRALADFPEDVAAAAAQADAHLAELQEPLPPSAEPWPPMRVGDTL